MIAIDMEMPSCCFGNNPCPLADGETGTCNKLKFQEDCDTTEKRPSNCPLIEIEKSESKAIESFKTKINSYDKDYSFSREEVLNILERYETHCIKQSEDCVSREEMIKEIQEWKDTEFVKMTNPYYYLEKRLSNLPPVTPTFPEDVTDGDVIKAMFPDAEITINKLLGTSGTVFINFGSEVVTMSLELWNAPYGRGDENG